MKTGSMGRRENISRNKTDSGSSTLIPPTHASLFSFFLLQEMERPSLCSARPVLQENGRTLQWLHFFPSIHPSSTSLCPGEDWMNEPSAGKAPSLSLFVELTLVESDQSCLALVSSDPSCGSIVSSSITVQSTLWESETPRVPHMTRSYGNPLPLSRSLTRLCPRRRTKRMMKRSPRRSCWRWGVTAACSSLLPVSLVYS